MSAANVRIQLSFTKEYQKEIFQKYGKVITARSICVDLEGDDEKKAQLRKMLLGCYLYDDHRLILDPANDSDLQSLSLEKGYVRQRIIEKCKKLENLGISSIHVELTVDSEVSLFEPFIKDNDGKADFNDEWNSLLQRVFEQNYSHHQKIEDLLEQCRILEERELELSREKKRRDELEAKNVENIEAERKQKEQERNEERNGRMLQLAIKIVEQTEDATYVEWLKMKGPQVHAAKIKNFLKLKIGQQETDNSDEVKFDAIPIGDLTYKSYKKHLEIIEIVKNVVVEYDMQWILSANWQEETRFYNNKKQVERNPYNDEEDDQKRWQSMKIFLSPSISLEIDLNND